MWVFGGENRDVGPRDRVGRSLEGGGGRGLEGGMETGVGRVERKGGGNFYVYVASIITITLK